MEFNLKNKRAKNEHDPTRDFDEFHGGQEIVFETLAY